MMSVNSKTLALIKRFEGLRLTAYRDSVGVWTVGYGHTSMAGPPKVKPGMRITKREAEEILRRDVEKFARGVAREIGPQAMQRLNENQFGALVSFAFNVGLGNFRRSSVLRAVKAGRLDDVPRLLMRWTKARKNGRLVQLRGLVRRRRAEGRLFMRPVAVNNNVLVRLPKPPIVAREHKELAAAWALFVASASTLAAALWGQILEMAQWVF